MLTVRIKDLCAAGFLSNLLGSRDWLKEIYIQHL